MNKVANAWKCVVEAGAELGEGALWDAGDGVLYWVDIDRARVHRYDPRRDEDRFVTVESKCGTVVRRESGGLVVALEDRVAAVDPDWSARAVGRVEAVESICDLEPDMSGNRSNDGKCDPAGRLWVGTMSHDRTPSGALYRVDCDGSVSRMVEGVTVSNGLCWSADGGLMYYIDTRTHRIDVFDFDAGQGEITGRRTHAEVSADLGSPDGMTIDADGNLWVALWGGGAVSHWDGRSGALLALYELPAAKITSCAFGGEDLATLYVTSARTGLSDSELAAQPLAGGLFTLNPGVRGTAMTRFRG